MRISAIVLISMWLACGCNKPAETRADAEPEAVNMTATPTNAGWTLYFELPKGASATAYRLEQDADFRPLVNGLVSIPMTTDASRIYIQYTDAEGVAHGPLEFIHEPRAELIRSNIEVLEQLPTAWVSLRDQQGTKLIYWTHVLSYRCGIAKLEYGIDTMTPTLTHELGDCDLIHPGDIDEHTPMFSRLPASTSFVSVRLTYVDGRSSRIQRFDQFER